MSLLDTLKQIKNEGFDPKKDNVASDDRLKAGTYPVRLKSAQAGQTKKGQDQIAIVLEVTSGKDAKRLEFINMSFDEGLPDFVKEKNGRILLKIGAMADVEFTNSDLQDEYSTADALARGVGAQFQMKLTISENKKNPSYPYRNYEFENFGNPNITPNMDEGDLPF